jgi:hypothetical protein
MEAAEFAELREAIQTLEAATTQDEQWEALDTLDGWLTERIPQYRSQRPSELEDAIRQAHNIIEMGQRDRFDDTSEEALEYILLNLGQHLQDILEEEVEEVDMEAMQTRQSLKNVSAAQGAEKNLFSEKLPAVLADEVASYLTGKTGSLGAQKSKLLVQLGKSGVLGKPGKGGRHTKKKRSSKKTRSQRKKTRSSKPKRHH